jgi:hypothetical protein
VELRVRGGSLFITCKSHSLLYIIKIVGGPLSVIYKRELTVYCHELFVCYFFFFLPLVASLKKLEYGDRRWQCSRNQSFSKVAFQPSKNYSNF